MKKALYLGRECIILRQDDRQALILTKNDNRPKWRDKKYIDERGVVKNGQQSGR